uniref:ADP,ATP carrier protein n=1 Tax=Leptocylindrus danicus TaxID=163516 RepID=A0A7S2P1U2_9STRA
MSTTTNASIRINTCFTRCIKYLPWKLENWDYGVYIGIATAIQGFGTGLAEVYFRRIFSSEGSDLSDFGTSLVYLALPFVLMIGYYCSYVVSKCIGRVQTILLFELTGTVCMFALSVFTIDYSAISVPVYLLKCALLWGSIPLETSVIFDLSSTNKFFALSLTMYASVQFSWDAGAAIGQIIRDNAEGYSFIVLLAAVLQLLGMTMYIPLLPVVNQFDTEFLESEEEHFATCHSNRAQGGGMSSLSIRSTGSMRSGRLRMAFACQSCNSSVFSGSALSC